MNRWANIALLVAAAVVVVAADRALQRPQIVDIRPTPIPVKGEVISVEAASPDQPHGSRLRQATVKLESGETIHAAVPDACVIFPGQATRLSKFGIGSNSFYVVAGDKEQE
jgi:hypothetical protein